MSEESRRAFIARQNDFAPGLVWNAADGLVTYPADLAGVHHSLVDTPEKREAFRHGRARHKQGTDKPRGSDG